MARYNPDGALDASFGTGGKVTTAQGAYTYEDGRAVLVQPDGKIVVAGVAAMVRYETNGALDATFGTGGMVTGVGSVTAMVRQPDGKLVLTSIKNNGGVDWDFKLTRYDDDGTLDGTFGSGGSVSTAISSSYDVPFALALQADGKLIAAGYTDDTGWKAALVRYESDGSLDSNFGVGGIVIEPHINGYVYDEVRALALQPDGKLIAGSHWLRRFNTDGSLDPTFGSGGVVVPPVGSPQSVVLQPNGKIVTAGLGGPANSIALVAYNPDGSVDPTFGSGGVATTTFAGHVEQNALVRQPDGKVLVGGLVHDPNDDFLVARYEGAGDAFVFPTPTPTSTAPTPTPTPTELATPSACGVAPASGCRKPTRSGRSSLAIADKSPDERDTLTWKWGSGAATTKVNYGIPISYTDYALCLYDETTGVPSLVAQAEMPAQGDCAGKPCWKELANGFKYADKDATPSGVIGLTLKAGAEGLAKIVLKARGVHLPPFSLPFAQSPTVTVQLVNDEGACWEAEFSAPASLNAVTKFRDKSD